MMNGDPATYRSVRSQPIRRVAWKGAGPLLDGERTLPEELPIAFSYQGSSYAVMMATPSDLTDFARGFSLTEGLVSRNTEIEAVDIVPAETGIVLRITIAAQRAALFWERRRFLAGPSGCGLCGVESLAQALRPLPNVESDLNMASGAVADALASLSRLQYLNQETRAVHAAAFWHPDLGVGLLREDIGRHNALDKLAGAIAGAGLDAARGAILLTSRVSVEMVQKAAMIGSPIIIAISAPTTLAVRLAERAGITLAAIARRDGFEVFSRPERFGW
jgi:FdhD protein